MYKNRNYDTRMGLESDKYAQLKAKFPSFFAANPKPVVVHVNDAFLVPTMKSMGKSSIDPHQSNMKEYKQPPQSEGVQLTYDIPEKDGIVRYEYSTLPPTPPLNDLSGKRLEFDSNSRNVVTLSHNKFLNNPVDLELLYFLYFYCPEFSNGVSPLKRDNAKYYFFIEEAAQEKQATTIKTEAQLAVDISKLSGDQLERVLTGLHLRVADNADTNFNTLFYFLKSASTEQKEHYDQLKKGINEPVKSSTEVSSDTGLLLSEEIQQWINNEKMKVVMPKEVSDEFSKPGWYWKPMDGDQADPSKYLKTPILGLRVDEAIADQRIVLEEQLKVNPDLYNKIKARWK